MSRSRILCVTDDLGSGGAQRQLAVLQSQIAAQAETLTGSVPLDLAACARMAEAAGYDEVNLNVGCPSDRVQNNMIGACLMGHPQLVADCVKAMRDAVSIPVTVKHRIGINGRDSYEELCDFVGTVRDAGCTSFTVHARIAILEGLSPKENRDIPPLRYDVAAQLKRDFPELEINLNGGIKTLEQCQEHLQTFDGVMLGREAYHNPYLLAELGQLWQLDMPDRFEIIEQMLPYIAQRMAQGAPLSIITRHILGLFQNLPGARKWRQALSGGNAKTFADLESAVQQIKDAMQRTEDEAREYQASH